MAVIGGFGGHISKGAVGGGGEAAIPCVRTWGISMTAGLQEAVCSATAGAKLRVEGNTDWTGQYTGYGALPDILPGDEAEFEGAITGDGASAVGLKGDMICDSITVTVDIEAGAIIGHTVNFGANGLLSMGTVTVPADTSVPNPATGRGLKVEVATDPFSSFSEVYETRTATLTISKANLPYVSSGTGSQTRRKEGNLDANLALTCYAKDTDGWASFPQVNVTYAVRMYTSATEFWLIKWLTGAELGNMEVDRETGALVGCSIGMALDAYTTVSATPTQGVITKPGGGDLWP